MLKNYFKVDENVAVDSFLRDFSEKKNFQYIILEDNESYVDFRQLALGVKDPSVKLKSLKRKLSFCDSKSDKEFTDRVIITGDRVIKTPTGVFDEFAALRFILSQDLDFLDKTVDQSVNKNEIYALNEEDKISSAKALFVSQKVNLLPVIDDMKVIGEVRTRDLLVSSLFSRNDTSRRDYFNDKYDDSVMNLPVSNLMLSRPHVISKKKKLSEAVSKMIDKNLNSLIVTDSDRLYSIVSIKDIFRLYRDCMDVAKYDVEIVGSGNLYEDEFNLVDSYARKLMEKLVKVSKFDNLKVVFKTIGNTEGTHMRKMDVKVMLSHGNHILTVEKEISTGTSDELVNDHDKKEWNIPKIVAEAFKNLEVKVKEDKRKQ